MDIQEDIVVPDNHGKVFSTNAQDAEDLRKIEAEICSVDGVEKVTFNSTVFPVEFTVFTNDFMKVKDVQEKVIAAGFHALPKHSFPLEI